MGDGKMISPDSTMSKESSLLAERLRVKGYLETLLINKIDIEYFSKNRDSSLYIENQRRLFVENSINRDVFFLLPEIYLEVFEHVSKTALFSNNSKHGSERHRKLESDSFIKMGEDVLDLIIGEYGYQFFWTRDALPFLFDLCRTLVNLPEGKERDELKKFFAIKTMFSNSKTIVLDNSQHELVTDQGNYREVKKEDVEEVLEYRKKFIASFKQREREIFEKYSMRDAQ